MASHWSEVVAWIFLGLAIGSSLVILIDEFVVGHRQQMAIMNVVHPITALYLGPVWLWAYFTRGRRLSRRVLRVDAERLAQRGADPNQLRRAGSSTDEHHLSRWHVADATSHCGAGCTLGDICGEWIVYLLGPWMIAGATLWPELILDFLLAWTLGVIFQYFTIVPMRPELSKLRGLWLAIRADTLSIVSFQVGLFAWMILSAKVLWNPPLEITTASHWWMMQVGMILGFLTAYPVNRWLITRGWKEKMDHRRPLANMVEHAEQRPHRPSAEPGRPRTA